jgi:hypothetical protein
MRALVTSIVLLTAGTAYAGDNEITYGGWGRALRASSADATTGDSLGGGQLMYARALDLPIADHLQVWAEAGMTFGGATGEMFQTMDTSISTFAFIAGAHVRYSLARDYIAVGAHLDAGTARTSLKLTDGDTTLSDSGWGSLAMAAVDVDLYAYRGRRFSLGLRIDVSYTKTQSIGLTMHRDGADDGTIKLPVMDTSFGHLDLSGPSAGGALIGEF